MYLFSAPSSPTADTETPASTNIKPAASRKNAHDPTVPTRIPLKVTLPSLRNQPHRGNDENLHEQKQPPQPHQKETLQQTQTRTEGAEVVAQGAVAASAAAMICICKNMIYYYSMSYIKHNN